VTYWPCEDAPDPLAFGADVTSEEAARFREVWDEILRSPESRKHHIRLTVGKPVPQLVLHFWWQEGSTARQETFGPWAVREDESHLQEIASFLKGWHRVTGIEPSSVTMALVQDHAQWLADRAALAGNGARG
jgi:hypothetical protein